ncbi:TetR/AcrR family transcriptional regulator C-terminal domain-containing protein [Streptomyces sp. RS10V-4]|uniref:TetR/AcrR family transcriptional regulator C-terminal domain-containing protein n=1 Tax=Streptomyces rhizoryzae TaxID=2932493 RepID=UPI002005AF9C|nr:TetR/AcrR family transcriptional regulator C-terminal domain-containing protein [Streptomyces rhizoryzae]MCK7621725.1 TetR/AcrR family transcriptional regulator C-terminal domain-containing protein [Streptomyces rhizoryzae]
MSIEGTGRRRTTLATTRADRAVREALALVDEGGLETLTMRRLADRLGVHLPTLYRLFAGKDALVDEMAEAILARALPAAFDGDAAWPDRVRGLAASLRAALLAQRDGARIVGGNYAAKRNNLTYIDTLVGCVCDAGLPRDHGLWAAGAVFCFVLGETLEEQGAAGGEADTLEGVVRAGGYPHLAAGPVGPLLDFDARFAFGLELLLAGIESATQAAPPRRGPTGERGGSEADS